jgi:hypothetical protein
MSPTECGLRFFGGVATAEIFDNMKTVRAHGEAVAAFLGKKQVAAHRRSWKAGEDIEHPSRREGADATSRRAPSFANASSRSPRATPCTNAPHRHYQEQVREHLSRISCCDRSRRSRRPAIADTGPRLATRSDTATCIVAVRWRYDIDERWLSPERPNQQPS